MRKSYLLLYLPQGRDHATTNTHATVILLAFTSSGLQSTFSVSHLHLSLNVLVSLINKICH